MYFSSRNSSDLRILQIDLTLLVIVYILSVKACIFLSSSFPGHAGSPTILYFSCQVLIYSISLEICNLTLSFLIFPLQRLLGYFDMAAQQLHQFIDVVSLLRIAFISAFFVPDYKWQYKGMKWELVIHTCCHQVL